LEPALHECRGPVAVRAAEAAADLTRCRRALPGRRRPLLLVGSTGMARALRRALPLDPCPRAAAAPEPSRGAGVLVVLGSVHPTARAQRDHAGRPGLVGEVTEGSVTGAERVGRD